MEGSNGRKGNGRKRKGNGNREEDHLAVDASFLDDCFPRYGIKSIEVEERKIKF